VIAALSGWHEQHEAAGALIEDVKDLPAHAAVEAYSVLTRLPGGLALPPVVAAELLADRFPGRRLRLSARENASVLASFAAAGVFGGATYDGLVALEALAHEQTLVTLDERAQRSYGRLGVPFRAVSA
jgi:predicted nucleic acid-binding protein